MAHTDISRTWPEHKNRKLAALLVVVVAAMIGLSYAAVPIYQLFCQLTGYGGTTQRASDDMAVRIIDREMAVRFTASVASDLPLDVKPAAMSVDRIGSRVTVNYAVTNLSDKRLETVAGFNVAPSSAGVYFNKIECFCFSGQTLEPGETKQMPIVYYVDPDLDLDQELDTLGEITLYYAFYAS